MLYITKHISISFSIDSIFSDLRRRHLQNIRQNLCHLLVQTISNTIIYGRILLVPTRYMGQSFKEIVGRILPSCMPLFILLRTCLTCFYLKCFLLLSILHFRINESSLEKESIYYDYSRSTDKSYINN